MESHEEVEAWSPAADRRIRGMLRSNGMRAHDIDDVVQTVFVEVCAETVEFKSERQFVAWCVQKAKWRAGDTWRHHGRVIPGDVPEHQHAPDVADLVGDEKVLSQIVQAIDDLTPRRRSFLFQPGDADARDEARQILRRVIRSIEGVGALLGIAWWPRLARSLRRLSTTTPGVRRSTAVAAAATAVALAMNLSPTSLRHDTPRTPFDAPIEARTTQAADFVATLPSAAATGSAAQTSAAGTAVQMEQPQTRPRAPVKNPLTGKPTGVEIGDEQPGEEGTLICGAQTLLTDPICLRYPEAVRQIADR